MSELDLNWHPEHCPWLQKGSPWKNEAAFWNYVRGGIRRGMWDKNPLKLNFIKKARCRIPNPDAKRAIKRPHIWGGQCVFCRGLFKQKDLEVDHIVGEHSLRSADDLLNFIVKIAMVTDKDLQLVCKPCHKIKSYSERYDMNFVDAGIEKETIRICKQSTQEVLDFLTQNGYNGPTNNAKVRREGVKHVITNQRAQSV